MVADPVGDIIDRVARALLCSPQTIREGDSTGIDVGNSKLIMGDSKLTNVSNKHYCEGWIVRGNHMYTYVHDILVLPIYNRVFSIYIFMHFIIDVAPSKLMICLSFKLPLSVAEAQPIV